MATSTARCTAFRLIADLNMVHLRKGYVEQVLGGPIFSKANSVPTYDELIRYLVSLEQGRAGRFRRRTYGCPRFLVDLHMGAHFGAGRHDAVRRELGADLQRRRWHERLGIILELAKNANEGYAGAGWPENRAAWSAARLRRTSRGRTAVRRQCALTKARSSTTLSPYMSRASRVVALHRRTLPGRDLLCVAASAQNPEGAFLMLAFLTTSSIMAMNEANANGVAPGYKSVLQNENLQAVSQPAKIWAKVWSTRGALLACRVLSHRSRPSATRSTVPLLDRFSAEEALDNAATAVREIMSQNGFYQGNDPVDYAQAAPGLYVGEGKDLPF